MFSISSAIARMSGTMERETSLGATQLLEDEEQQQPEGSVEVVIAEEEEEEDDREFQDLPPGRMHATRKSATSGIRLKGNSKASSLSMSALPSVGSNSSAGGGGGGGDSASSVGSGSSGGGRRSRSAASILMLEVYPHSPRSAGGKLSYRANLTATTADGNSSISSLEDVIDSDILYDRAGLQDDVMSASSDSNKRTKSRENFANLPPVNERLSEDTLEDVHAFSDVKVPTSHHSTGGGSSQASRANSITTADADKLQLDPLMEEEGDEDDDDADSLEEVAEDLPPVILTNMENLSLQQNRRNNNNGGDGIAGDVTANSSSVNGAAYDVANDANSSTQA